jgi:FkbM family methyltransferase
MAEGKTFQIELQLGSWSATLGILIQKGLRPGTFIDIGSADGYFGLSFWRAGLFRDVTVVSIDANPVYEPTLKKIHGAIGGHYRICALDEKPGSLQLHTSAHPYWGSAVPPDDPYWATINGQVGGAVTVPCRTLDSIVEELKLPAPYVIKMDVQGFEPRVLRGALRTLHKTTAIITKIIVHNFRELHSLLDAAGFELYDLTDVARGPDHTLGWFYASYLSRRHLSLRTHAHWDPAGNDEVLAAQAQRRASQLEKIDRLVAKINAEKSGG